MEKKLMLKLNPNSQTTSKFPWHIKGWYNLDPYYNQECVYNNNLGINSFHIISYHCIMWTTQQKNVVVYNNNNNN